MSETGLLLRLGRFPVFLADTSLTEDFGEKRGANVRTVRIRNPLSMFPLVHEGMLTAVFRPSPTKGLEFPNKFIPGGLLWEGHTLGNRIEVNIADNRSITILVLNLEQ